MHDFQTGRYATEDCVFLVEPRCYSRRDEELGAVCIRTCICHTYSVRPAKGKEDRKGEGEFESTGAHSTFTKESVWEVEEVHLQGAKTRHTGHA